MRRSKTKATFYSTKSQVQNAFIINQLRTYCSKRFEELAGYSLLNGQTDLEFVESNASDVFLDYIHETFAKLHLSSLRRGFLNRATEAYAWVRRFDALSSKNLAIDIEVDPQAAAFDKFLAAEQQCKKFNENISSMLNTVDTICGVDAGTVINKVRRKVQYYMGDVPSLRSLHCAFGPGANSTCRKKTSAKWKLSSQLAVAEDGRDALSELAALYPRLNWSSYDRNDRMAHYGLLSSVPKKATIDRMINIEPILNTFVQRPVGTLLKKRLLRVGCNLYDQSKNRNLARIASVTGSHATIDMSSASDLISFECVKLLCSYEWFEFLATWRTDKVFYKPNEIVIPLEKFSSMGNGYTFELESCIFFACAQVAYELVGGNDPTLVSVYGDDIVLPTEAAAAVEDILTMLGFSVNTEKSFTSGIFRESCGGDYLFGVDVRPFYVKDKFTDARLVAYSNQVARSGYPDPEYRSLIESFITLSNKLYGPEGYGDGHLIGYPDRESAKPLHPERGFAGSVFETFIKVPKVDKAHPRGYSLLPAYTAYVREDLCDSFDPYYEKIFLTSDVNLESLSLSRVKTMKHDLTSHCPHPSRETDPHTLRGGSKTRKIRVYVLNP